MYVKLNLLRVGYKIQKIAIDLDTDGIEESGGKRPQRQCQVLDQ